jgi:tight adherence protein B
MSEASIRILLYVLIFLATLLVVEGGYMYARDHVYARRKVNKRLTMIAAGHDRLEILARLRRDAANIAERFGALAPLVRRLERKLARAGIAMPATRYMLIMAGLTVGAGLLGLFLTTIFSANGSSGAFLLVVLFASSIGIGGPLMFLNFKRDRRLKKMEAQFPVALDVFVRGLRAGHPVSSALELLTNEMPDPIGSEFGIVVDEVTYGLDLRDALQNMADRSGLQDMNMFVVSVAIQNETGGNLAEILENLSKVIRERASLFMKVRALSSEGRMSGYMLSALPVFTFATTFAGAPEFYLDVADDPLFFQGTVTLLVMYAIGVWLIRRIIDLKV